MGRAILVLWTIASCGRLDFGVVGDAGSGDGAGGDGAPACTPFDIVVPTTYIEGDPRFVWTGTDYILITTTLTAYVAQHLAVDGTLGAAVPVLAMSSGTFAGGRSAIAWTGSVLGLVYTAPTATFASYTPSTGQVSGPVGFDVAVDEARVVWTGDRFGAMSLLGGGFRLVELGLTGAPLAPVVTFSETAEKFPTMVYDGTDYVIPFGTTANTVELLDATSSGGMTNDLDPTGTATTFAQGQGGFAVVINSTAVSIQFLDGSGASVSSLIALPAVDAPLAFASLTGRTDRYHIDALADATPLELESMELDATGAVITPPTIVTTFPNVAYGLPSTLDAPGRHAIAVPYELTGNIPVISVIQQCI